MATPTSPYKTFTNLVNAVIADAKESTSSQIVTLVKRYINEGNEQVTLRKKRDWLDQQFTVQVNASVTGTCTVTENSNLVTFETGTTFPTGVELQFWNNGFEEIYNVTSSTLNVVTLNKNYLGTTSTAASGFVYQSSIMLDPSIRTVYQVYHQYDYKPLTSVGPQQMRALQESGGVQLDYARYMTIFGTATGSSSRRLSVYPFPNNAYTIYMDVNTFVTGLVNDSDEPSIPIQYRQILYWYGLYKLYQYHRNDSQASYALNNFNQMLSQIDAEMRAEIEFPTLKVSYPRGRTQQRFTETFDIRLRDS